MGRPETQHRKTRRLFNIPGHAHELTFSCHHGLPLLGKDRTRLWFIEALDRARTRWDFELWAYVIMPEHVHLLIYPRADNYDIAAILKAIKQPVGRSAIRFLRHHSAEWLSRLRVTRPNGRVEYRFWKQGGGYDRNIRKDNVAWTSVEYIHNNPVRRYLVADAADWPWSSAGFYSGRENVPLHVNPFPGSPRVDGRGP